MELKSVAVWALGQLCRAERISPQHRNGFQARGSEDSSAQLPAQAKEPLDTLVKSYNVARESWLTYRGAIATNVPSDAYFNQLTKN